MTISPSESHVTGDDAAQDESFELCWTEIRKEILPLIKAALDEAFRRGLKAAEQSEQKHSSSERKKQ